MTVKIKFLSLSTPRSGTMMLNDILQLHPAVKMHNFYSRNAAIGDPGYSYGRDHFAWEMFQWQESDVLTHLGTSMHYVDNAWVKQFTHFTGDSLWRMLARYHDRYITLTRDNQLRRYLSIQVGAILKTYDVHESRA